jgi:hypothetical protein
MLVWTPVSDLVDNFVMSFDSQRMSRKEEGRMKKMVLPVKKGK